MLLAGIIPSSAPPAHAAPAGISATRQRQIEVRGQVPNADLGLTLQFRDQTGNALGPPVSNVFRNRMRQTFGYGVAPESLDQLGATPRIAASVDVSSGILPVTIPLVPISVVAVPLSLTDCARDFPSGGSITCSGLRDSVTVGPPPGPPAPVIVEFYNGTNGLVGAPHALPVESSTSWGFTIPDILGAVKARACQPVPPNCTAFKDLGLNSKSRLQFAHAERAARIPLPHQYTYTSTGTGRGAVSRFFTSAAIQLIGPPVGVTQFSVKIGDETNATVEDLAIDLSQLAAALTPTGTKFFRGNTSVPFNPTKEMMPSDPKLTGIQVELNQKNINPKDSTKSSFQISARVRGGAFSWSARFDGLLSGSPTDEASFMLLADQITLPLPEGKSHFRSNVVVAPEGPVVLRGTMRLEADGWLVEPDSSMTSENAEDATLVAYFDEGLQAQGTLALEVRDDLEVDAHYGPIRLTGPVGLVAGDRMVLTARRDRIEIQPAAAAPAGLLRASSITLRARGANGAITAERTTMAARTIALDTRFLSSSTIGEKGIHLDDGTVLTTVPTEAGMALGNNINLQSTGDIELAGARLESDRNIVLATRGPQDRVCLSHGAVLIAAGGAGTIDVRSVPGGVFDDGTTVFIGRVLGPVWFGSCQAS